MGSALLLAVVGPALVLIGGGQPWAHARATNQFGVIVHVAASGKEVNAAATALALVGLAAVVAVLATRRIGRLVVGAIMALSGAGIAVVAAMGASDTSALRDAASKAGYNPTLSAVTHSAWPWLTLLGGVLLLAGGVLTVARGRTWPGMSRKYDAPTGAAKRVTAASTPADIWKALDRGEDPTA
ncbi:hypothetical protein BIV57_20730 [Mangrovactinospora gilvigrisea]|uniref:TIGR02234 family membrane protein n=2 Tax=Mangrovactinospora gilvigrisea TaxID=1428644 RepID=A0A1J7BAH9_9ACTN|nr:hypothetical protein BIV57_20730 [Mangrovactinospora gilvigrisea]